MWTSTFYGGYDYWLLYHKVTFDGVNRLIRINYGETDIDFKIDIYSDWKEWVELRDNSKFLFAITAIGGEAVGGGQFVGSTYFLENGWKIKPWEGDHSLTIVGNYYTRDLTTPFASTDDPWSIYITTEKSLLVQTVEVPTTSSSEVTVDVGAIAAGVWQYALSASFNSGSFGDHVGNKLLTFAQHLSTK